MSDSCATNSYTTIIQRFLTATIWLTSTETNEKLQYELFKMFDSFKAANIRMPEKQKNFREKLRTSDLQ